MKDVWVVVQWHDYRKEFFQKVLGVFDSEKLARHTARSSAQHFTKARTTHVDPNEFENEGYVYSSRYDRGYTALTPYPNVNIPDDEGDEAFCFDIYPKRLFEYFLPKSQSCDYISENPADKYSHNIASNLKVLFKIKMQGWIGQNKICVLGVTNLPQPLDLLK
jgi:hypothetical protein